MAPVKHEKLYFKEVRSNFMGQWRPYNGHARSGNGPASSGVRVGHLATRLTRSLARFSVDVGTVCGLARLVDDEDTFA